MKFIKVWSDNFQGEVFTLEAYNELRLQMSTGDFSTHQTMICVGSFKNAIKLADLYDQPDASQKVYSECDIPF